MKFILFIGILLLSFYGQSQVRGTVYGRDATKTNAIYGASVVLLRSQIKLRTDEDGKFEFILPKELPDTMVIQARDHKPDTVLLTKDDRFSNFTITLYSDLLLPEVIVAYKKGSKSISKLKTLLTEEISSDELKKAACCNLSESFETNASVDVSIIDAVSGAKQIQMMGLAGIYTQIQMENIPYLRGLESTFGLNSIPGTWVNSIQITKGTGTVVNGYESMAGLINIEIKKPDEMEELFVNGYGNIFGRGELNVHGGRKISKNNRWSTGIFAHGATVQGKIDNNSDGFKDLPTGYNAAVLSRWAYHGPRFETQFGVNGYLDQKVGGELNYNPEPSNITVAPTDYGVFNDTKHADFYAKTGFLFKGKPYRSIGVLYNVKYQETDAVFGSGQFTGIERRGYINAIYDDIIGSTIHKTRIGVSAVYANFTQRMDSLNDDREEIVPGVFAEYTYTGLRLVNVLGARVDYHNLFGAMFSPRMHTKYTLTEWTDLRFTAGRGWRIPNYIIDNLSLLATGRTWTAPAEIKPEVSWNIGGSAVQEFKFRKQNASLILDYYYTFFENQLVVDRDVLFNSIVFQNIANNSFSHSFQAELTLPLTKVLDLRMAYKYLDVQAEFNGELQSKITVPKHRGFVNLGYQSRNKRWMVDATTSIFGKSRLPVTLLSTGTYTTENESEIFPMVSGQITHVYKRWEFYVGGENLTNYVQNNPILDAQNPFSTTFDATRVWGPVLGAMIYGGFRFIIPQKEDLKDEMILEKIDIK
ncbi:MAG: TonB-dependent receptor [Crocinitomicaceae bacterium]|nr:TonB-dependent receptor [Crocinitomicaceae bacterium]